MINWGELELGQQGGILGMAGITEEKDSMLNEGIRGKKKRKRIWNAGEARLQFPQTRQLGVIQLCLPFDRLLRFGVVVIGCKLSQFEQIFSIGIEIISNGYFIIVIKLVISVTVF